MHKASGKYTIVYMTINSVITKVLFHVDSIMYSDIYNTRHVTLLAVAV